VSIAGWGLRESSMMVAFGYAGLPRTDGVIISLLYGAMIFAVGAAGGLAWILSSEKSVSSDELNAEEHALDDDGNVAAVVAPQPVREP
jgi:hypothetical protein